MLVRSRWLSPDSDSGTPGGLTPPTAPVASPPPGGAHGTDTTPASSPAKPQKTGRLAAAAATILDRPEARAETQQSGTAPVPTPEPPKPNPRELFEQLGTLAGKDDVDSWLRANPTHPVAIAAQGWASRSLEESRKRDEARTQQAARQTAEVDAEKRVREALVNRYVSKTADDDTRLNAADTLDAHLERVAKLIAFEDDPELRPQLDERATERLVLEARDQHPYWKSFPPQIWEGAARGAETPADVFARMAEARVQWAVATERERLTREFEGRLKTATEAATAAERDRVLGQMPRADRGEGSSPRTEDWRTLQGDDLMLAAFGGGGKRRNGKS